MYSKRTIVLGASTNPERYSHKAVLDLVAKKHEVYAIGIKEGKIGEIDILTGLPKIAYAHTMTLYLNPTRQVPLYEYILKTKPKRLIFNPGTENPELAKLAIEAGIKVENACTLVLLRTDQF